MIVHHSYYGFSFCDKRFLDASAAFARIMLCNLGRINIICDIPTYYSKGSRASHDCQLDRHCGMQQSNWRYWTHDNSKLL